MGGYVNGSICSECGGKATATGDWRYGEKVETVECHNFDCGYVVTKENGNETGHFATQEQIQELRDWDGGYEEDKKDFMCIITKSYTVSLKAKDKYEAESIIEGELDSHLEELHESYADIQILPFVDRKLEQKKLNLFERTALYCSQLLGSLFRY